jgi:thymidylate synthase (FAD)
LHKTIREVYDERINSDVAREQARKDLPLSTYTEAYWKIDLHNLFHFLALRMDSHAQYEIRSYANVIGNEIVSKWCPIAWESFKNYRINAISLSEIEIIVLKHILRNEYQEATDYLISVNILTFDENKKPKRSREIIEVESKLKKLDVSINWENYLT